PSSTWPAKMRKCGPLSEGFSTRTSLALALRASVRTVPVKPLPFEVKVPMVAIVVSFQFSGPRPRRPRWLATDRRRSTRTPQGPARSRGQPGRGFLDFREEWTRSGQGKKVVTGCCGDKSEAEQSDDGLRSDMPNRGRCGRAKRKRPRDTMADGVRARRGDAAIRLCTRRTDRV